MSKTDRKQKSVQKYKKKLKHLSEIEIYSYADYLDGWLKIWGKNKDNGNYGKLWKYFFEVKEKGLKGNASYKKLGNFGLFLVSYILYGFDEYEYPTIKEKDEPMLVDCVIALHIFMEYLKNEK